MDRRLKQSLQRLHVTPCHADKLGTELGCSQHDCTQENVSGNLSLGTTSPPEPVQIRSTGTCTRRGASCPPAGRHLVSQARLCKRPSQHHPLSVRNKGGKKKSNNRGGKKRRKANGKGQVWGLKVRSCYQPRTR